MIEFLLFLLAISPLIVIAIMVLVSAGLFLWGVYKSFTSK